jgi:hypothetical protein
VAIPPILPVVMMKDTTAPTPASTQLASQRCFLVQFQVIPWPPATHRAIVPIHNRNGGLAVVVVLLLLRCQRHGSHGRKRPSICHHRAVIDVTSLGTNAFATAAAAAAVAAGRAELQEGGFFIVKRDAPMPPIPIAHPFLSRCPVPPEGAAWHA